MLILDLSFGRYKVILDNDDDHAMPQAQPGKPIKGIGEFFLQRNHKEST